MARRKRPSAAALKYNVDSDVAPKVVASGEGVVAEKIIEKADNRLYEAKHTGRNKIIILNGTR